MQSGRPPGAGLNLPAEEMQAESRERLGLFGSSDPERSDGVLWFPILVIAGFAAAAVLGLIILHFL